MFKAEVDYLPKDFKYPDELVKIIELNLTNINPWIVLNNEDIIKIRYEGVKKRYPNRILIPFAQRLDNDDIACFEIGSKNAIQIIHDFASSGYEQKKSYRNFWDWFKSAIDDMINFD